MFPVVQLAFCMSDLNIDAALREAFGGGSGPGVVPIGLDDRIAALPADIRPAVESYIDRATSIPLPNASSLSDIGRMIEQQLASDMPELSVESRSKLASYYTYVWK